MELGRLHEIAVATGLLAALAVPAGGQPLDVARVAGAPVRYAAAGTLEVHSVPVVHWRRGGLMKGEAERQEIERKILYPVVRASRKPIAAIVVEFFAGDERRIGAWVIFGDGESRESTIARAPDGTYEADAYRVLLAKPTP